MSTAVPFPQSLPTGYQWFENEPEFNPAVHLALEAPETVVYLTDIGYSESEIVSKATTVAASSPFRVLSDEGAQVMLEVARSLREHAISCERIQTPPRDRVVAPDFPGPGYAIALHGDMVVHRGAALNSPGERISMVNGYISMDTTGDDQHRHEDLKHVDDPELLYTEWAKHSAWRASERLNSLVKQLEFNADRDSIAESLEHAIQDVTTAITQIRDTQTKRMHHL